MLRAVGTPSAGGLSLECPGALRHLNGSGAEAQAELCVTELKSQVHTHMSPWLEPFSSSGSRSWQCRWGQALGAQAGHVPCNRPAPGRRCGASDHSSLFPRKEAICHSLWFSCCERGSTSWQDLKGTGSSSGAQPRPALNKEGSAFSSLLFPEDRVKGPGTQGFATSLHSRRGWGSHGAGFL